MEETRGRYVFPGNIKLPVEIINNLNEKERAVVLDVLENLRSRLISCAKYNENACFSFPISKFRFLYVDFRDNRLNFYIDDIKNKEYTQILTEKDCERLVRCETVLEKEFGRYINIDIQSEKKKENNLTQTLIHSAYEARLYNRGSPTVFKKHLSNDFDLDR